MQSDRLTAYVMLKNASKNLYLEVLLNYWILAAYYDQYTCSTYYFVTIMYISRRRTDELEVNHHFNLE